MYSIRNMQNINYHNQQNNLDKNDFNNPQNNNTDYNNEQNNIENIGYTQENNINNIHNSIGEDDQFMEKDDSMENIDHHFPSGELVNNDSYNHIEDLLQHQFA